MCEHWRERDNERGECIEICNLTWKRCNAADYDDCPVPLDYYIKQANIQADIVKAIDAKRVKIWG